VAARQSVKGARWSVRPVPLTPPPGLAATGVTRLSRGLRSKPMERMPGPGDLISAFSPQPGRCFRMVHGHQLQADHCRGLPAWKGIWTDRKGKSWYVEACRQHAPKMTGGASEGS
jgi:hypothetical protein